MLDGSVFTAAELAGSEAEELVKAIKPVAVVAAANLVDGELGDTED